jgi:general secretion pathway protein N
MTGWVTQTRLTAALAGLLALLLLWELLPAPPPAPPPALADRAPVAATDDSAAQAGAWMAQILARPLFRADRRPLAVLPASVDLTVPRLTAIVITAAGRSAIFIGPDGGARVLGVGGRSGVYEVQAITPDSVRLTGPTGALTLHPQFATAPPAINGRAQDTQ